jgi:phosphoserine aminotransferase
LNTEFLGRSHRAKLPKQRLKDAIDISHRLLGLPADWKLGIVPGSDTGAFEIAMWSLLGSRPVDVLVWESFSSDWARDLQALGIDDLNLLQAEYGELPDLGQVDSGHDVVMVYNGTTSGVCLPDLDWLDPRREGLVLCDDADGFRAARCGHLVLAKGAGQRGCARHACA